MASHTTSIASRSHTRTWPESSSLVHTSSPRSRELTFTSTAFGADPEAVRCVAVADTPFAYKHLLYRSYCSGCTNKENEIIRSISISSEFTCANTRSKVGFPSPGTGQRFLSRPSVSSTRHSPQRSKCRPREHNTRCCNIRHRKTYWPTDRWIICVSRHHFEISRQGNQSAPLWM